VLFPSGRAFDERYVRAGAGFDVFEHRFTDREVDRDIMPAQLIHSQIILAREDDANLVASLARASLHELTHRTMSE
jgi:hypothetical protein